MEMPLWARLKSIVLSRSPAKTAENSLVSSRLAEVEAGKESALPSLFTLVFDQHAQVREDAVEAIVNLTQRFSPVDWRRLDAITRSYSAYVPYSFPRVEPDSLESLTHFGSHQSVLLGLASMNGNGYVRQQAVRNLSALAGEELPFLLLRLNDWVDEVRQDALAACSARLHPEYAVHYLESLPLVLGLAGAGRHDFHDFIASVEGLLSSHACRPVLLKGLSSANPIIRRASFRLALDSVDKDAVALFQQAFLSSDPVVRRKSAQILCSRPAGDPVQETFLDRLSHDALAAIRSEYLVLCYEKYPERAGLALRDALLDVNPSVRSAARYYLRQHESVDYAQFYRAVLEIPGVPRLAAAIAGLGETGQSADARRVVGFLHHPTTIVRRAAVVALGRLNGEAETTRLLHALDDVSAKVARAAREALEPHVHSILDDVVWSVLIKASSSHGRRNTLSLISVLPKWRSLPLLLHAGKWLQAQEDEGLVARLVLLIRGWQSRFNSSAVLPTRIQLDLLQEQLQNAEAFLPAQTAIELRRIVQSLERMVR